MLNFVAICKGINTTPGISVGLLLCNVYECMRIKNTIGFNSTLDMTCKMDHAFFAHSISDDTVGALRAAAAHCLLPELLPSSSSLLWIEQRLAHSANASWASTLLICLDSPQVTNESHDDGSFLHILDSFTAEQPRLAQASLVCLPANLLHNYLFTLKPAGAVALGLERPEHVLCPFL